MTIVEITGGMLRACSWGLRHDLPKFHPINYDISAGLFFPSMRFDCFEQSWRRQPLSFPKIQSGGFAR